MPEENTPQPHVLPFEVPANFAAVPDSDLHDLIGRIVEHSAQYSGLQSHEHTADTVNALETSAALARQIRLELEGRAIRADGAAASAAAIAAVAEVASTFTARVEEPPPVVEQPEVLEGEVEPAVTAAARRAAPRVRDISHGTVAPVVPASTEGRSYASMRTSADVPGFASGQQLDTFAQAAKALAARIDQYPAMTASRAQGTLSKRPVTVYDPQGRKLTMKSFTRHGGVQFARHFPDELRVQDGQNGYAIAEHAASERRLPGGSLIESAKLRIKNGHSITAAAAWCAPSDVIYQLCELEGLDGLLAAPELQTSRGGWQIPIDGGPNFASIWNGIGNAGDTHLTEAEVQGDVLKVCNEIPCPDFDDVRLGVDYVCLTGGLLQRRGYPEVVARFSRGAMVALAHKMNQGFIAALVAASGPATVIPQVTTGDDAASALLAAVELAIIDIKYANRMNFPTTLEVVMPMWFLAQIRAALARRRGVMALDITDAEILDWFAIRRAVPHLVYDWQDAYTDLATGPGGAVPLSELPTTGQFLVYPAGTWVKAVQDVVSLDTIYDSTNLQTNQYTAIFAEDGWAALQMCPDSRLYEVALDPSGVVGCCPPELISL